jgi:hypothetical protein
MPSDFSKGKIYKITNDFNDDVYVGSTCDTLIKRFSQHKGESCRKIEKPLYKLINEIGFNRFRIELIEDYPCTDKYQLRQREGHFIREMGTLNILIAGRDMKQWREENENYNADYWQQNREKYLESNRIRASDYYLENQEKAKTKFKDYYVTNSGKIKEQKKEVIICECGCTTNRGHIARHIKTSKHLALMASKQEEFILIS